jgi:glyceraldehyde-3-phosphate dehydrogenase/erythrose-4-phosphate dehydrogenase
MPTRFGINGFGRTAWYDNEWGYAHRLADLLARMGSDA